MLDHLNVLDLSYRLPGPLAGKLLTDLGAKVIKLEDQTFKDPFIAPAFLDMDESFAHWYDNMNKAKDIVRIDFKNNLQQLQSYIDRADIVLMGLPEKLAKQCQYRQDGTPQVFVHMISSHNIDIPMHDLNIMAQSGLLNLHVKQHQQQDIIAPPFFPFAGVLFAQHIKSVALASYIKTTKEQAQTTVTCSLEEATVSSLAPLHISSQDKYLHNGRYPCYNIYKIKDGHVALAAVEEKFWRTFCEVFQLNFTASDRFGNKNSVEGETQDDSIKNQIKELFKNQDRASLTAKIKDHSMCLTIF